MNNTDQDTDGPISFFERYSGFSDNQIKEILRNHKSYQEPAVLAAVKIAIERQIINNEQDLMAPEYQANPSAGISFFPKISNTYHYKKILASIFRVLFLLSLFPIIFGVMNYAKGQFNMTFLGGGIGILWLIITFLIYRTEKMLIVNLQILLLLLVVCGIGYSLLVQDTFKVTDFAILVSGMIITLYILLFLKQLIKTKPEHS